MKPYTPPQLREYGTVAELTAIFGDPFTGDQAFDLDGNVISESGNSGANGCLVDGEIVPDSERAPCR